MRDLLKKELLLISFISFCWIVNGYTQPVRLNAKGDCIVYIKLPPGISRPDVLIGSQRTKTDLLSYSKAQLRKLLPERQETRDMDLIIVFTDQNGEPILPEKEKRSVQNQASARVTSNELTYTFNSPSQPWSPSQLITLNAYVNDLYPAIKTIIGNPFFNITVNVSRDPLISFAGLYYPSLNEMVLRTLVDHVFCHESIHAFRDDYIMGFSTYEEGMTRATEVEVFNQLVAYTHDLDEFHSYGYDQFYEALNRPALRTARGDVHINITLDLLRYQVSSYVWAKAYLEDHNFLKQFNDSLYSRTSAGIPTLYSESSLRSIFEKIKPVVEGLPVAMWYDRQFILNTAPPSGYKLYQRINQYTIDYFYRDVNGYESPQGGVTVSWKIFSFADVLLSSGSGTSSPGYGWISFTPGVPLNYNGRIKVVASAQSPQGLITDTVFNSYQAATGGVFGVVEDANTGMISITPLDTMMSTQTTNLTNGAFFFSSLQNVRGRFRVDYSYPDCRRVSRIFTKDRSHYFLSIKKEPVTYWVGSINNSWHSALNWSGGAVPDECTDVIINAGTQFNCVIDSPSACRSLTLKNGAVIIASNNLLIKSQ